MSSIIRWRRSRRAGMDSGLFMGRLLLLERSQNAQCSPGAAQPGCYVSALTASSHVPLPRSGFVVCPARSIAQGGKSPIQPDGGEGLAKHKGSHREGVSEGSVEQNRYLTNRNRI